MSSAAFYSCRQKAEKGDDSEGSHQRQLTSYVRVWSLQLKQTSLCWVAELEDYFFIFNDLYPFCISFMKSSVLSSIEILKDNKK